MPATRFNRPLGLCVREGSECHGPIRADADSCWGVIVAKAIGGRKGRVAILTSNDPAGRWIKGNLMKCDGKTRGYRRF